MMLKSPCKHSQCVPLRKGVRIHDAWISAAELDSRKRVESGTKRAQTMDVTVASGAIDAKE